MRKVLGILSIVAVLGVYGCGNGAATTEQKTDSTVAPAADTTAVDTTAAPAEAPKAQ